jgi:hypothetical protein
MVLVPVLCEDRYWTEACHVFVRCNEARHAWLYECDILSSKLLYPTFCHTFDVSNELSTSTNYFTPTHLNLRVFKLCRPSTQSVPESFKCCYPRDPPANRKKDNTPGPVDCDDISLKRSGDLPPLCTPGVV